MLFATDDSQSSASCYDLVSDSARQLQQHPHLYQYSTFLFEYLELMFWAYSESAQNNPWPPEFGKSGCSELRRIDLGIKSQSTPGLNAAR
jgi:hypothetical protein